MYYSTYITSWNGNPINLLNDMINKSVLKANTRIILAFASFNFSSTSYIPGLTDMSLDDLKNFVNFVLTFNN